jgi:hypothetical protein
MATGRRYDIMLYLNDSGELFEPPEGDYFSSEARYASGIEALVDELKPKSLAAKTRTTIVLPEDKIEPGLEQKIGAALARYCQHKIQQGQRELIALRWRGLKALQDGLVFLAACLLISIAFENAEFLPEFLRRFLGEGFLIAGWVSLWHPIEVLLYEWWPFSRENRIYESILKMEIVISAKA